MQCIYIGLWLLSFIILIKSDSKPNIIFILADDLGFGDVGYNQENKTEVVTHNIDNLAQNESLILTRHYTHYSCTPTRSSLQSGRLPTHVEMFLTMPDEPNMGLPRNMTAISSKFLEAGYTNYMVGKWDIGMATFDHTPKGRGYNESLFYFSHENEFWTQRILSGRCYGNDSLSQYNNITDLWMSNDTYDGPALDLNGTLYEEFLFAEKVYEIIEKNEYSQTPFYLFYAPHATHAPLQVPQEYYEKYDFANDEYICANFTGYIYPREQPFEETEFKCRTLYHSMLSMLDDIVGNIVDKLKSTKQWENTLLIFSGDNGGNYDLTKNAGNNYPLKGAKFSPWEGGMLSTAFVSGGVLPENRRGQTESGMIHICDWWSTFCEIIVVEPNDTTAEQYKLPQIDSISVWDLITGINLTSPRTNIWVNNDTLIDGNYKYLECDNISLAGWTGPIYPNSSSNISQFTENIYFQNCSHGCLYDVVNDTSEYNDISQENPDIVQAMKSKLYQYRPTYYSNNETGVNSCPNETGVPCACWKAVNHWGTYFGPYQYLDDDDSAEADCSDLTYCSNLLVLAIIVCVVVRI